MCCEFYEFCELGHFYDARSRDKPNRKPEMPQVHISILMFLSGVWVLVNSLNLQHEISTNPVSKMISTKTIMMINSQVQSTDENPLETDTVSLYLEL